MGNFSLIISLRGQNRETKTHENEIIYNVALKCKDTKAKTEPYHSDEATITQLCTCVIKIVHIQMKSLNVKIGIFQP